MGFRLRRRVAALVLAVSVVCALAAALIERKASQDYRNALAAYRSGAHQEAIGAATDIREKLTHIHAGLRTIGLLPSVRRIDRHGRNLDADARASIQQLYNNLKSTVDISEVYVVPASLDPERIDPVTGEGEAPILMFDELIVNAGARALAAGDEVEQEDAEEPEVEIYEYRALQRQMAWFAEHAPSMARFVGLTRPMLSSEEVITCDNTVFVKTGRDADRMGVILSVPFYDMNGKFAGTVSAIMRSAALAGYLPGAHHVLLNPSRSFSAFPVAAGQERRSLDWVKRAAADPSLFYSELVEVDAFNSPDKWLLWVGKPNSEFHASAALTSVHMFRLASYGFLAVFAAAAVAIGLAVDARLRASGEQAAMLHDLVEARTAELRGLADEQTLLKQQADAANKAKSIFFANMSHELRTPLNAIIGYGEIIQEDSVDAENAGLAADVGKVLTAARHLLHLIDDILDLSKIEAGRVEVELAAFDVARWAEEVFDTVRPSAEAGGVALDLQWRGEPGEIHSDAFKLKQCLLNLLSNAIKFSSGGSVKVVCGRLRERDRDMLVVDVIDTGIGMSPEQVARLFSPFAQAEKSTQRRFGGTGLGLTITLAYARLLGGDIAVRSVPGKGSAFRLKVLADARQMETQPLGEQRAA